MKRCLPSLSLSAIKSCRARSAVADPVAGSSGIPPPGANMRGGKGVIRAVTAARIEVSGIDIGLVLFEARRQGAPARLAGTRLGEDSTRSDRYEEESRPASQQPRPGGNGSRTRRR